MDREASWRLIASERRSLADLLRGLSDTESETPSLCMGWRVRDVAAHVALAPQYRMGPLLVDAVRARGSFHRLNRRVAIRHAQRPVAQIADELDMYADSRRLPVVTNHKKILLDILVHGHDIAIPLGIRRPMPTEAAAASAALVWSMGWPFWARRRLRGVRLTATDSDWAAGDGDQVRGPIDAILMLLTGRAIALRQLSGPGVSRLTDRLRNATSSPGRLGAPRSHDD